MMQPAHIPLGHLYSSGVQPVHQYSPEEQELVSKLVNRDQYLQDQQAEQVGKLMASVRMPEILPELQNKALARLTKYKQDLMDLYKSQRDKRKLTSENLLKAKQLEYGLNFDLSTMKQIKDDFDKANVLATGYASRGLLSQEEEAQALDKWKSVLKDPNAGLTDIPLYSTQIRGIVTPKEKAENELLKYKQDVELRKSTIATVNEGVDQQEKFDEEKVKRNVQSLPQTIKDHFGGEDAILQMAKDSWIRKSPTPPNWLQINNANKKEPILIEPVLNPDINGSTFPLNSVPVPWSGQFEYTDEGGKKKTTAAKGEITQIDQTPTKLTAVINVKYKKRYEDGYSEDAESVKTETVTPDLISRLDKLGYDTKLLQQAYDNFKAAPQKTKITLPPDTQKKIDKIWGKAKYSPNTKIVTPDGEIPMGELIGNPKYGLTPEQIKRGIDNGTLSIK